MEESRALIAFNGKGIRRSWHNDEWWFVLEDVVFALTDSSDTKQYINKMRQRDSALSEVRVQIAHTLKFLAERKRKNWLELPA